MNSYPVSSPSEAYITNYEIHQVQSNPKDIFVDLDVSSHHTPGRSHRIEFQVDSGCSCNTMHITHLEKLSDVDRCNAIPHTSLRLLLKVTISTKGQAKLNCSRRGSSYYEVVVQIITSQQYYPPLLGLADSTHRIFEPTSLFGGVGSNPISDTM